MINSLNNSCHFMAVDGLQFESLMVSSRHWYTGDSYNYNIPRIVEAGSIHKSSTQMSDRRTDNCLSLIWSRQVCLSIPGSHSLIRTIHFRHEMKKSCCMIRLTSLYKANNRVIIYLQTLECSKICH